MKVVVTKTYEAEVEIEVPDDVTESQVLDLVDDLAHIKEARWVLTTVVDSDGSEVASC